MLQWLVYQIQIKEGLTTKLEVNKLMNKEKNEVVVVIKHTNITEVMVMKILLLLKTFSIIFSSEPIYRGVIVGKCIDDHNSNNKGNNNVRHNKMKMVLSNFLAKWDQYY